MAAERGRERACSRAKVATRQQQQHSEQRKPVPMQRNSRQRSNRSHSSTYSSRRRQRAARAVQAGSAAYQRSGMPRSARRTTESWSVQIKKVRAVNARGVNRRTRRRDKYSFPSLPPSPLLFSPLQARRKRRRRRRWRRLRRRLAAAVATTRGDGGGENEAGGVCVGRAKTPSARPLDRGGWSTVTRGGPSSCVVQVRRH